DRLHHVVRPVQDRQRNANQTVCNQQAVSRGVVARHAGTVRAVNVRKQRILTGGRHERRLGSGAAQAHAVAGEMAGGTRAAIRAQRLEKRIARVDRAVGVVRADGSRRISKLGKMRRGGRHRKRRNARQRQNEKHTSAGRTWSSSLHIALRKKSSYWLS